MTFTKNDITEMGEALIDGYQLRISKGGVLVDWYSDCLKSCLELQGELKKENFNREDIRRLVNKMKKEYATAKPPVIGYWCCCVEDFLNYNEDL